MNLIKTTQVSGSKGTIIGVTNDFTYTNLYEESIPLIILQRNIFQNTLFVRLSRQSRHAAHANPVDSLKSE
jgi:hypothetical protein